MAPSPVRYKTPDSLDQDNWQLPSPALRSHPIPHPEPLLPSDSYSRPEAIAGSETPFERRLASAPMPPPGPAYFHARRALWWQHTIGLRQPEELPRSRRALETLLASDDAHENDEIWRAGVGKVNRALADGARFKHRMPLRLVVKIVMAGWVRDGTWPRGAVVLDPDDDFVPQAEDTGYMETTTMSPTTSTPDAMSGAFSPWTVQDISVPRDKWTR